MEVAGASPGRCWSTWWEVQQLPASQPFQRQGTGAAPLDEGKGKGQGVSLKMGSEIAALHWASCLHPGLGSTGTSPLALGTSALTLQLHGSSQRQLHAGNIHNF